jgi:uncharacterized protein YndB with AHSA1/START domain
MTDIRLERGIHAPRDWVVHAWCDPELLAQWFCPNPSTSVRAELDVDPNGFWKVAMGTAVVRGEYTEVRLPDVLAFTWQWEHEPEVPPTTVKVTFGRRSENSTEVLLEHLDFQNEAEALAHYEGWAITLDRLAQMIQSHVSGYSWRT